MKTRREIVQSLRDITDADAVDFIASLDAGARHLHRIRMVNEAADAAAKELLAVGAVEGPAAVIAAAVKAFDIIGVGGKGDAEGMSTTRIPPFQKLGKGRKQASDGWVWTAAVEATFTWGYFRVRAGKLIFFKNDEEAVFNVSAMPKNWLPWLIAVVRRGMWIAAKEECLIEQCPPGGPVSYCALTEWTTVHAQLMLLLKAAKEEETTE